MNKIIKEYLKNTIYTSGAIYKVSPQALLEDFYNFLVKNNYINEKA